MNIHSLGIGFRKRNDYVNSPYSNLDNYINDFSSFYQYNFIFSKKPENKFHPTVGIRVLYNNKFITTNKISWGQQYNSNLDNTYNSNKELLQMVLGANYISRRIIIGGGVNINLLGFTSGKYNYFNAYGYTWDWKEDYYPNNHFSKFFTPSDFQKKHLLFYNINLGISYRL